MANIYGNHFQDHATVNVYEKVTDKEALEKIKVLRKKIYDKELENMVRSIVEEMENKKGSGFLSNTAAGAAAGILVECVKLVAGIR